MALVAGLEARLTVRDKQPLEQALAGLYARLAGADAAVAAAWFTP
ncbi:hypothetical protein ACLFKX_01820 [Enterobacter hormaechei]